MKLLWDDSYNIGNEEIDSQHRKWLGFYNELAEAMMTEKGQNLSKVKAQILRKMYEYGEYHFQCEEEYMRSIGYPDVDKHWRLHKDFKNEIYRICREYDEGNLVLNREILDMIRNWLTNHILNHDKKIMEYKASTQSD